MENTKTGVIYSISYKDEIKYIGQTKNFEKRCSQHCSLAQNRGGRNINRFLYKLLSNGEKPAIEIIDKTDDVDSREIYWIKFYKDKGIDLLNMTDGGTFDYDLLRRKKLEKPWGNTLSPVQRRLMEIKIGIRRNKKKENYQVAEYFEKRYIEINKIIKKFGRQRMNEELWIKYGK